MRWVWYSSNLDTDPTTPGFNHKEWLVFRIAVNATLVNAPEPGSLALAGLAVAGLWSVRRRRV